MEIDFNKLIENQRKISAKLISEISGIGDRDKEKFKKTINSMVRNNDAEYKELQRAFINKEKDVVDLWFLFRVASGIVSNVKFENSDQQKKSFEAIEHFLSSDADIIYQDIINLQSLGVIYGMSAMKRKLSNSIRGKDGMDLILLLSFVRQVFDDTEIAKSTTASEKEEEDILSEDYAAI